MKRVLIIHTFGLGDMVMFTPALQKLVELYPDVSVDYLIFQKIASAPIKKHKATNQIYYSDFQIKNILKTILEVRKSRYDMMITTSGTDPLKSGIFGLSLRSKIKVGEYKRWYHKLFFDKSVRYIEKLHRVENNNLLVSDKKENSYHLRFFGIDPVISKKGRITLGIHAGSNPLYKEKRWAKEKFATLIDLLKKRYNSLDVVIFAGPEEEEESRYIAEVTNSLLISGYSLEEVAKHIAKCDIFINSDSGLGHIAGCFDVEVYSIFGPAKDYKAKVFSKNAYVIKLGLECQPCYGTKRLKMCKNFECLYGLTPQMVFDKVVTTSKVLQDAR
ncbi:ADP-heptose--lipooligosaccharide heptosyltransferase II [hydrothermal vent metagenome]|uniref:ADP-heptose--lipooligosaccharide heptosyltransferase II n=1 Tax=hydrothermal vent metagenome TaxID=652676 RepID=A0A1W1BNA8_9ZZZZ